MFILYHTQNWSLLICNKLGTLRVGQISPLGIKLELSCSREQIHNHFIVALSSLFQHELNKFLLVLNQFWWLIMKILSDLFFNPIHLINHHLLTHETWIFRLSDKQGRSGSDPAANKLDPQDVKFRRLFVGNLDKEWDESVIQGYFGSLGDIEVSGFIPVSDKSVFFPH